MQINAIWNQFFLCILVIKGVLWKKSKYCLFMYKEEQKFLVYLCESQIQQFNLGV
jgi:hypothetical protein